jgi:hypothetical protein
MYIFTHDQYVAQNMTFHEALQNRRMSDQQALQPSCVQAAEGRSAAATTAST